MSFILYILLYNKKVENIVFAEKMLRLPLVRVAGLSSGRFGGTNFHTTVNTQQSQDLVEVFIDDIPVQVPPGTTVLQVNNYYYSMFSLFCSTKIFNLTLYLR